MLLKLNFHPVLQEMTGQSNHTFDIGQLSDIKNALVVLFPKMRSYINNIVNGSLKENLSLITPEGKILAKADYEFNRLKYEELTLVPIIEGGGGKTGGMLAIIAGIALIAAALVFSGGSLAAALPGALGQAGFTVGSIVKLGIGLALSGLMQAVMKPPKPPGSSSQTRRNNDMFDALENTTDTQSSVPLIYGMPRVAGQMVSAHLETITHGESDVIFVGHLFYDGTDNIIINDESDDVATTTPDPESPSNDETYSREDPKFFWHEYSEGDTDYLTVYWENEKVYDSTLSGSPSFIITDRQTNIGTSPTNYKYIPVTSKGGGFYSVRRETV